MSQPFTKAIDLLYLAKQNGVDIDVNEDQLQLKLPKNRPVDKSLIEQLKNNKQLIIDFLNDRRKSFGRGIEKITRINGNYNGHLPLSFSQERLWFIHEMEGSTQYHIPAVLRLRGKLDQQALSKALQHIVTRHEVLRTVFLQEDGHPFQVIRDWQDWNLNLIDGALFENRQEALQEYIQDLISQPFDLAKNYMVRANLISLDENEHMLVVVMHHIASDGWSTSVIVKEVAELYAAYAQGRESRLSPLELQYADYAVWQRNHLKGETFDAKLDYWKQKLSGVSPLQLPPDRVRPPLRTNHGATLDFSIDKSVSEKLQLLCQRHDVTLYMTLLAAFKVLLHKYSGQDDICVGSPTANRTQHEIEELIGFFVNTLALRSEVSDDESFSKFLQQVRETTMDAFEHQDIPFEKVVENVVKERDLSRSPLFQVMFVLQNTPEVQQLRLGNMILAREQLPRTTSKFDLTLFVVETSQGLQCSIEYATDLFVEETINKVVVHFKVLLDSIVRNADEKIGSLTMITDAEEQQVIHAFNQTTAEYPATKSVVDLFEAQVAKTPEATAVVIGNERLSYRELNEKANQLASYLRAKGVQQETLVPICIERGFPMIIGVLGILKTGAAYVPIDPEYPAERIAFMIDDSDAGVILASEQTSPVLRGLESVEIITLTKDLSIVNSAPKENLGVHTRPEHLVYVLYTSGSTGKPKGVKMTAGGMVNLLSWQQKQFDSTQRKVLQFASLNFDVSFQEIFSTLCFGSTLVLITSETRREIPEMIKVLVKQEVTHLFIPFIVLKSLVEYVLSLPAISLNIQEIIVAGEQLKLTEDIWKFTKENTIRLINQYGPTEAHVVTSYEVEASFDSTPLPPIGKPIDNSRIYVLNAHHKPLPVNVPGEIYIGGVQVARGYLNNEQLTATKFLTDPFTNDSGGRMYRTGDLGRWLPDGNIEYLGRIDGQVKVRGYRIELGEIEAVLHQHDGVRQAVVLARPDKNGNNRLIGYVTPEGVFDRQSIVQYLKHQLPEFMVPSQWVEMEKIPVTPNGKVDRRALPDPDASELLSDNYAAPRNETEAQLAAVWRELLGVAQVGIHSNFFELGGHSLMAIRVISAIRKRMDVELTIKDLFTYTTVAELSAHLVKQSKGNSTPPLEAHARPENIPLSFSQERLWFIDQLEGSIQYHLFAVLRLKGKLDVSALEQAFKTVLDRHEVLRSVIYQVEGDPFIRVKDDNDLAISVIDDFSNKERSSNNELRQYITGLVNEPFDLSRDNMLRASLIRLADDEHILVATMHHIASDGWSISILVREVVELYESFIQRRTPALIPLSIQYPDYAIWQKNYLQGDILDRKLDYWKQKLRGVSAIQLPVDRPRPAVRSNRGAMHGFAIDKNLVDRLQQLSQQNGVTLFMTLLGAFNVLLHRYSDQEDICVGTPIAGRQHEQLENLIGFFINTLALRTEVNRDGSFLELLSEVRRTTLEAYEHQEVPFEKIVEAVVKERDMSRTPVFQVMFVLQNTPPVPALKLGEVRLTPVEHAHITTQFDLSFIITETSNGLQGSVNYSTDLYEENTIERMVSHFQHLLSAITIQPQQAVGLLPMLSEEEEKQLLYEFNDTTVDYPANKTIVDLFEEQVRATPDNIALIFENEVLTYASLNERANQLAHYLDGRGVTTGTLVPVCMEKSSNLMIGILAILKAGGAYVPLDVSYPAGRINFMLEDTHAKIILTNRKNTAELPFTNNVEILEVDDPSTSEVINKHPVINPATVIEPNDLAYIMYTSGSTGRPKGVLIEHGNVVSLVRGVNYVSLAPDDILLSTGSPSFDATTFEYWSMLLNGGRLVLCDEKRLLDSVSLKQEIAGNKVSVMWFTSSWFNQLVENEIRVFEGLKMILVGGEKLSEYHIGKVKVAFPDISITNGYGPTENTTFSLTYEIGAMEEGKSIPIGKPLSNRTAYILDKYLKPVPVGVTGEIYVGGAGVARSYLDRPELSTEKFIEDPFSAKKGSRMYKTGDLGRWLDHGNIEYLGRIDEQVKIRGYRIELGEIETVLQQSAFVQQATVVVKKDSAGGNRIVAYVIPNGDFSKDTLSAYLKDRLPQYMIPASWVSVESFPLTPNGKIDKRSLPDADIDELAYNYIAPRNEIEHALSKVWQDVLSVPRVGITDNFFEIGGHSLLAMRLISFIRKELNVEISIKELFTYPTIDGLATRLASGSKDVTMPPLEAHARPENIPLSFSQERLWFIDQLEGSIQYHISTVLRLKGKLDVSALEQAFKTVLDRHEVLRSVIYQVEGDPFIRVKDDNDLAISVIDDFSNKERSSNNELRQYITGLVNEPFDLSRDNMLRASLIRLADDEHILVATMHHIASDGWSISILVREVVELYESFIQRRTPALIPLSIQYPDYAIWQKNYLQGDILDRKLDYWKQKLRGVSAIQLPVDRPRPAVRSNRGAMHGFAIDKNLVDRLQQLSQQNGVTLFMTLLGAFNVLLHRYSDQEDICVGTPIAGRQHEQLENLIGFFINTLALRTEVNRDGSFLELLSEVRRTTLEAYEHQEVPFEKIVEAVVKERDMSRTPVFQVMFVLQNTPPVPALKLGEVRLTPVEHAHITTQFDLSFIITETSNGLQGSVNYSTDLYEENTIERMVSHFQHLLSAITIQPQQAVGLLPMLSEEEEKQLLYEFNDTTVDYPANKTIVDLFEEQVRATPDNIALIFENEVLTYNVLNEKANQLAHYLDGRGVTTGTLVPVCMEKSSNLMIGILAILKAGGAYVPLDVSYPAGRINFMLEDTHAKIILTNRKNTAELPFTNNVEILEVDDPSTSEVINKHPVINPATVIEPNDLAYIMYTSGSTGRPKGVLIEHGNVVSLVRGVNYVSLAPDDILLSTGSPSFDATTFEYWSMLLNGGRLVLCDEKRLLDSVSLKQEIAGNKVSVMWFTSSWFNQLVENEIRVFEGLKMILVGGEKLSEYHIGKVKVAFPDISITNGYGPTENTTFSLTYEIGAMEEGKSIPIGKPLSNRTAYILDKYLKPVPVGVTGEIYVGGAGVARSYLDRPELSTEKFIEDPFSAKKGSRMYKTGDLGRWLDHGNIEYLGRIDEQVKIRGYRIELGEIETVLQQSAFVQQATVVVKKDSAGGNRIVAYVIPNGDFSKDTLSAYLKDRLPQYMIPASWVSVESFPLTPNGKIDKRSLPDADIDELAYNYIAPRNEIEHALSKVWQDVLSVPRVGITDNFFEIGGHSLLAMRLISFIRKELNVEISIKELFTYPTIDGLATRLASGSKDVTMPPLEAHARPANIPLSFSQERLWFIDQLEGSIQYHIPAVLRLKGKLDVSALEQAFKTVLDRHEVLRSVIYQVEGDPFIRVKDDNDLAISVIDDFSNKERSSNNELRQYITGLVNEPFDLSRDNMLRASLIRLADDEHILVATMHHIASDGWSISILVREVVELYESFIQRRTPALIPLSIQYPDYAIWQKNYLQGDILDRKLDYWKQKLGSVSPIQLPVDRPRPAVRSNRGAMHGFAIDKNLVDRLQQLSQQNGVTLFMTLLGAFNVLLHRYSDQEDICVGTPIAGRQHEQLENLIGFFINTLALRTEVNRDGSFLELLSEVRRTTLEAYEHQEVPFEKIVEAVVKERDMSRTPVFQVMFVLQNTPPVPALKLGEVRLTPVEHAHITTQFDLSFIITETSNGLQGSVNYSTDLYEENTIERMVSHFQHLLSAIAIQPQQAVGLLPMLSEEEEKQLLYEFNDTTVDYPANKTIVDLFEEQVKATPDNIALIFENEVLTYNVLNEKANQLAHYLKTKGTTEGALVAICMRRSPDMIIGLLGVLKAGAAYVPIDPDYPQERKDYMLQDSAASLVISDNSFTSDAIQSERREIVQLNGNSSISNQPTTNIQIQRLPHHLAYVIYTSGSTGKPKGVMIEHGNVYSFICWSKAEFSCSNFDIVYASTSICFDLSIFEIFYPLSVGKKIRLLENGMQIEKFVERDQLILANTVPVVVDNLLHDGIDFQNITVLNMAGEPVPASVLQRLDTERMEVRNLYGPTEDTTYSTVFRLKKQMPVLIGKPISNTRAYIVDKKNQLVPIGVAGEICLAGAGVTRGYLNRPELTSEKFVNDLYSADATSKIYKTGDLGRWLSDGNIEYLGRIDQQVKVRGYRIELGEVEAVLQESELVKQVVVLAKKDSSGSQRLVAYVVPKNGYIKESLITYLKGKLPQYMVPTTWVSLDTLPLTPNGKIDKKALPEPEDEGGTKEYFAPTNETEEALARIWAPLLSLDRVGITDNFFEVGGHSLIVMRLISSIRKKLNAEISIKEIFAYPTIKSLAARLNALDHTVTVAPIKAGQRPDFIPLSFSQERLWFIDRLEGTVHYHMPAGLRLEGNVNTDALTYGLQQIVNRHEVLRTVIMDQDGEPFQLVLPVNGFKLELVDGSAYELQQLERKINDLVNKPYDLSKDHMIRASLIRLKEQEYVLAITVHHIAADGWSIPIVLKELVELYNSYVEGRTFRLPVLPVQYADYSIWQRENLAGEVLDRKLDYWKQSLGNLTPLQLPLDFPRPSIQSTRGAVRKITIDKKLSSALDELAKRQESTLFMTLLAAFNVLLHRYSGQQSICVGTPIAGRQQQELEDLIGFFVNTLALRINIAGNETFIHVLTRVKETVLTGYTYQDVPFEKIVEAVVKERDMARSPVFQVMFILQNATPDPGQKLRDVQLSYEALSHTTSKFDITLSLTRTGEGFVGAVEYCVDLFTQATIDRMMQHFQNLLRSIVKYPQQKVGLLSMLNPEEELQLIRDYNSTGVDYPKRKTVVNLFEEQVALTPDSPALIFNKERLSYKQLNAKANQLAHYLLSKGVGQQSLVPLCVERSIEMVVSVLAILKTGAAYVPIDPEYPQERINFKLNDTKAGFIIVGGKITPKIKTELSVEVFDIDSDWDTIADQPTANLDVVIMPQDLVYVIYTSGSTGKPKGVQMAHTGMVNLLLWQEKQFRNKKRRVLQFASLNFDVSFQEIFSTLSFGSSLYLLSEENRRDPAKMMGQLKAHGITHLFLPYIVLKSLAEYVVATGQIGLQLEEIITAGEQLKVTDDIRILLAKGNIAMVNQYGPTEAHVVSSYRLDKGAINMLPPIGKPIDNTQLYILNESKALMPAGIAGELYIGGVQVARGYLNRPELTEEKFVDDLFGSEKDRRMYRTGDLARWLPDGNIEFLGRVDDQVKIRGYRVEVGEIENILQEYYGIRQVVVKTWEDLSGNKQLIAYVVPQGTFHLDSITAFLKQRLPDYMLPSQWVKMESFPVTGNGKIDRKALPLPDTSPPVHAYMPATNETEEKVLEIWRKLLGVQHIGVKNNFFEVGGHSLLAMRLIAAIRRQMGVDLPLLDIYESDVQSLAAKIISRQKNEAIDPLSGTLDSGTSEELTAALEMVHQMEKGIVEWGANGHSKYLVPIKKGGTKNPFFGIISFKQYRVLGSLMPDDQPLFYLPPTRSASVEEIAAHYVREMKLSHPSGPYTIGGFCGAGMIAMEIAEQLKAQGDEVSALILFEYYAPESMIRKKSFTYKKRLLARYKRRLIAHKKSSYSQLELLKFVAKKAYKQLRDLVDPPPPKFITSPKYGQYRHKPYSGRVILFQASVPPLEATDSPMMGWSNYFNGEVKVVTIPGGHLGIFREPEIRKLAEELTAVLEDLNNTVNEMQKSLS